MRQRRGTYDSGARIHTDYPGNSSAPAVSCRDHVHDKSKHYLVGISQLLRSNISKSGMPKSFSRYILSEKTTKDVPTSIVADARQAIRERRSHHLWYARSGGRGGMPANSRVMDPHTRHIRERSRTIWIFLVRVRDAHEGRRGYTRTFQTKSTDTDFLTR